MAASEADLRAALAWMHLGFKIGYEPAAGAGRHPPFIYWEPALRTSPRLTMGLFEAMRTAGLIERASRGSDRFVLTGLGRRRAADAAQPEQG